MLNNNKGGIIFGFVIGILFVLIVAAYFLPVTNSMKKSAVKQLISCPSQATKFTTMLKDNKLTYYEYFMLKFNCTSNEIKKAVKKTMK